MNHTQLSIPFATLVAGNISSREVHVRLAPDLPRNQARSAFIRELRSHALQRIPYQLMTSTAIWEAYPRGKTATGRYVWDLYIRPADLAAA